MELPKEPDPDDDRLGQRVSEVLDLKSFHHDLGLRLVDLDKLIAGADSKVQILTQTSNSLTRKAMAETVDNMRRSGSRQ